MLAQSEKGQPDVQIELLASHVLKQPESSIIHSRVSHCVT